MQKRWVCSTRKPSQQGYWAVSVVRANGIFSVDFEIEVAPPSKADFKDGGIKRRREIFGYTEEEAQELAEALREATATTFFQNSKRPHEEMRAQHAIARLSIGSVGREPRAALLGGFILARASGRHFAHR